MNKNKRNLCILCLCVMLFCILFKLYSGNNSILVETHVENFELGEGEDNGLGEGCNTIHDILDYFSNFENNVSKLSISNDFTSTTGAGLNLTEESLYGEDVNQHDDGIHLYKVDCGSSEGEDELNHCNYYIIDNYTELNEVSLFSGLNDDIDTITTYITNINIDILNKLGCIESLADNFHSYLDATLKEFKEINVNELIPKLFDGNGYNICNDIIKKIDAYNKFINNEDNIALINLHNVIDDNTGKSLIDNIVNHIKNNLQSLTENISWEKLKTKIENKFKREVEVIVDGVETDNKISELEINIHIKSIIDGINNFYHGLGGMLVDQVNPGVLGEDIRTLNDAIKGNSVAFGGIIVALQNNFNNTFKSDGDGNIIHNSTNKMNTTITGHADSINRKLGECNDIMNNIKEKINIVNNQLATNIAQQGSGAYAGNIGSIVQDKCFNHLDKSEDDVCINYLKDNVYGPGINKPGCVVQCSVRDHTGNCLVVDEDSVNLYANIYGDAPMKIHTHPHTHGGEGWGDVIPSDGSTEGTTVMVNSEGVVNQLLNYAQLNKRSNELKNEIITLAGTIRNSEFIIQGEGVLKGDAFLVEANEFRDKISKLYDLKNERSGILGNLIGLEEDDNIISTLKDERGDESNDLDNLEYQLEALDKAIRMEMEMASQAQAEVTPVDQFTTIEPFVGSMYATF